MGQPSYRSWGSTPHRSDTINILLQRIAGGVENISSGGTGGGGLVGVVPPEGVVTADPGTTYVDRNLHTFWYKETGSGNVGWLQYV